MSKAFEVVPDACSRSVGAVLMQEGHPVAFGSRKMIPAELNYTTSEQECLATVYAMQKWRCYLEGLDEDQITLVTDHNPNVHLQDQQNLSRRQVRWVECLQRFHFKWSYRPGRLNVADPVSRRPYPETAPADHRAVYVGAVTRAQGGTSQSAPNAPGRGRPVLTDASAVALFEEGYQIDDVVKSLVHTNQIHSAHGLLWRDEALVVPDYKSLRQDMLYNLHDANLAGHPGARRTNC